MATPQILINTQQMIILDNTNSAQTIHLLTSVSKSDLPVTATFEFEDLYSGNLTSVDATLNQSGLSQSAEITVDLTAERKYDLTVKNGTKVVHMDTVFVTEQANDIENYSETKGDFVYFKPTTTDDVVVFEPTT